MSVTESDLISIIKGRFLIGAPFFVFLLFFFCELYRQSLFCVSSDRAHLTQVIRIGYDNG